MEEKLGAFLLLGFAGWRVAYLLVYEDGPFDLVARLRRLAGVPLQGEARGFLPGLFSCVFCMSLWTVAGLTAVYALEPWIVVPVAAWGLALLLQSLLDRA